MTLLTEYDTTRRFQATVLATERLTVPEAAEVRHLQLRFAEDPGFRPGQLLGLVLPGPPEYGAHEHFRLYSVADISREAPDEVSVGICVRRMSYVDNYSGELFAGRASNFLCDCRPGDSLTVAGPYGIPFPIPEDRRSPLLMVGLGTGIAPFRAFMTQIYRNQGGWEGPVRLFHGAQSGLELLYHNDHQNDFAAYYDEETFQAIEAVSPNPHFDEPVALAERFEEHMHEVREFLEDDRTHVYVAGLADVDRMLERILGLEFGVDRWNKRKAELKAGGRWIELLY